MSELGERVASVESKVSDLKCSEHTDSIKSLWEAHTGNLVRLTKLLEWARLIGVMLGILLPILAVEAIQIIKEWVRMAHAGE